MRPKQPCRAGALPALLAALTLSCGAEPPQRIVLITLDTLRYDRFAGAPDWPADMPSTRRFADEGLVFSRHYAATSTTQPTHASLLTGLHPWQHGVSRNGLVLAAEIDTLAELLAEAGFRTAAAVGSFPLHSKFGFAQGFELYEDDFELGSAAGWGGDEAPETGFSSHANHVTDKALALFDRIDGPKQFFWLHYFDPHGPYGDSVGTPLIASTRIKAYLRRGGRDVEPLLARAREGYSRDVRFLDESLGEIFERLRADSEVLETHVFVVADHGESFGERGAVGHGKETNEEQLHVPFFIHSPRVDPGVDDLPNGSVDVAATLLSIAGIGNASPGGRNLLQRRPDGGPVLGMRRAFPKPYREVYADGSFRVVRGYEFFSVEGPRLLTGNSGAVAAQDSEPVGETDRERLEGWFASFERALDGTDPADVSDAETRRKLEALGYAR